MELLIFSSISKLINVFKSFNIDNICNVVEISYSQDFIEKKNKSSYETSIITLWFWFVKNGWSFSNNLCIKKEIMNNFVIKIIIDKVYYMKYYCWAWFWWKILYSFFFSFFFFFLFYIFVCCISNYTMFIYLLEFKKIISFSYKEDFVSRCVYMHTYIHIILCICT